MIVILNLANLGANLFQDYVVLLPQDYYEASILQDVVNNVCEVPATDELYVHLV